ncbi:lysophospholipid acyltransferase family protein [Paenibacillus gansuensis]|uniref:Lysophospholipid acyltransferase family protein n=1 Tax=Paenibacillus gansuensis TaxID=306542 RepID=A0ABW5PBR7_9BACL
MIPASKSKPFNALFSVYNEYYLLRRHFHSVRLRGAVDPLTKGPVLYVMNHSSWWDGLIAYHAEQTASARDHYMMMDERQMSKFSFFRKIGAFSIDKTSPAETVISLKYAMKLLQQDKSVWIFPQGDIRHQEVRPLTFSSGVGYMLERCAAAAVIPVTLYYTLGVHQKAEATMYFGTPISSAWDSIGRKNVTLQLQQKLETQLDLHKGWITGENAVELALFHPLWPDGKSASDRFDAWRRRLSGWNPFSG